MTTPTGTRQAASSERTPRRGTEGPPRGGKRRAYFAYGLNLDAPAMAARCPGARLVGPARLPGYRFVVNAQGLATVVPERDGSVQGVLWCIGARDEHALDRFEGVAARLYRKAQLTVHGPQDRPRAALVYLASDARPGAPRPGYLERVVAAAEAQGLDPGYIAELRRWLARAPRVLG